MSPLAGTDRALAARPTPRSVAVALALALAVLVALGIAAQPAGAQVTGPVFVDGQAQPVFSTVPATWIRQELWVETTIDSDFDGVLDRIHIDVTRVQETDTIGLNVPVVMEVSPYYGGNVDVVNWAVDHELGQPPATRPVTAPDFFDTSPIISRTHKSRRGCRAVSPSCTPRARAPGSPRAARPPATRSRPGPKAVVDWLNGRAKAYTAQVGEHEVAATWTTGKVGMIGTSYNGTLPIGVATTGVEGLEAIVPISAISSWYDYYRANGTCGRRADSRARTPTCSPSTPTHGPTRHLPRRDRRHRRDAGPRHRRLPPFWDARNYMDDIANVRAGRSSRTATTTGT